VAPPPSKLDLYTHGFGPPGHSFSGPAGALYHDFWCFPGPPGPARLSLPTGYRVLGPLLALLRPPPFSPVFSLNPVFGVIWRGRVPAPWFLDVSGWFCPALLAGFRAPKWALFWPPRPLRGRLMLVLPCIWGSLFRPVWGCFSALGPLFSVFAGSSGVFPGFSVPVFGPLFGSLFRPFSGPFGPENPAPGVGLWSLFSASRALRAQNRCFGPVFGPFGPFLACFRPFSGPFGPLLGLWPGTRLPAPLSGPGFAGPGGPGIGPFGVLFGVLFGVVFPGSSRFWGLLPCAWGGLWGPLRGPQRPLFSACFRLFPGPPGWVGW